MLDADGRYIMNEEEAKLVEALTSGRYTQANGYLRKEHGFCCLGVYCDMQEDKTWVEQDGHFKYMLTRYFGTYTAYLPEELVNKLNWFGERGTLNFRTDYVSYTLVECNDSGMTFAQIADIIKAGRVLHFGEDIEIHEQTQKTA
jgi:hypothetical protein